MPPDPPSTSTGPISLSETGLGVLTPTPHFTVPETEEYQVVLRGLLMQLKKGRRDIVIETLLVALGAFAGSVVSSVAALLDWPLDVPGFLNCLLAFGSAVAVVVCTAIARGKANDFNQTMADILKGRRCDRHGNEVQSSPSRHGD